MVPDNIRIVFHALNEICSGGEGVIAAFPDNWESQHLQVFKIIHQISNTVLSCKKAFSQLGSSPGPILITNIDSEARDISYA
jgi:hypothetical protein